MGRGVVACCCIAVMSSQAQLAFLVEVKIVHPIIIKHAA